MESIRRLFGGVRPPPPPPVVVGPPDTKGPFEKIAVTMDKLDRIIEASIAETNSRLEKARECDTRGQRTTALSYIAHVKASEIQFNNLVQLKLGFETTVDHLRMTESLALVMEGMDEALRIMKALAVTVNPEAAEEIALKIEKRQLEVKQTQAVLAKSRRGMFPRTHDDKELEDELDALMGRQPPEFVQQQPQQPVPVSRDLKRVPLADQ